MTGEDDVTVELKLAQALHNTETELRGLAVALPKVVSHLAQCGISGKGQVSKLR